MKSIRLARPGTRVRLMRTETADPDVALPAYQTDQSAGMDLRANFAPEGRSDGIDLAPGARVKIPSGFSVSIPEGFEIQIRPRSGLALKHGVTLVNAPGTIDSDYRGEVGVILINLGTETFHIAHGDRIAQMVLAPVTRCDWHLSAALDNTDRGSGGFGSTGT